jgi:solute:Na+ symporter, SSS family
MKVILLFIFSSLAGSQVLPADNSSAAGMQWSVHSILPPLPGYENQPGLAGSFSGIIDNKLVIAGGANFPDGLPWEGGERRYWNDVYINSVDNPDEWRVLPGALPGNIAYGVSVTLPEGLLIIGGVNNEGCQNDVFLLKLNGENLFLEQWPPLPVPLAFMTGTIIGNEVYLAGGQTDAEEPSAGRHFFVLDIRNRDQGWRSLESWPGPARSFAVSAAQSDGFDNCFYLFSGRDYAPAKEIEVLYDGYEYNPRLDRWKKIDAPDGPQFPVMAGTAFSAGVNHIVFLGGADGTLMYKQQDLQRRLNELVQRGSGSGMEDSISLLKSQIDNHLNHHPGFSSDILLYHTVTNIIVKSGEIPLTVPVTTNLVRHINKVFITGGESRPGVRTAEIISGEFITSEKGFGFMNYLVVMIYFGLLVWIGWFFSKRQKNTNDFFRGGNRIPWWAAGLSIFGTALSAITFMAIPAKAYATDWSYLLFNAGIVVVAPVIILLFIPFYRKLNITTAYEYLEQRFNVATRVLTSVAFILFQVGRMGVVLFLPSIALNVVTGIDIFIAITLMGMFSLAYTMMGGIEAVVWTDALQVVVLLGGAVLAVILISFHVEGGFTEIITRGARDGKFHLGDTGFDLKNPTLITVLVATMFTNLTTYGTDQTIVQRYLTTSTEKNAGKSIMTNAILTIPASLIFFFVGTALYVFFKDNPLSLNPAISDPDAIFPWYIFTQMPPGVSGLLLAGIFAAAMSTLSSSMNSSATAYLVDIHYRFGFSEDAGGLRLPRIATLILGLAGILFALFMATWDIKSLWDEFQKILGLVLGGLGGLFLLGLLTKRANGAGALAGIAGSVLVQIWISQGQHVHLLLYTATGFVSCFVIGYLASFFAAKYNKDTNHLTIYELIKSKKNKHS